MGYSLTESAGNDHFTIRYTKRKGIPTYATIMIDISGDFLTFLKISLCGLLSFCQIRTYASKLIPCPYMHDTVVSKSLMSFFVSPRKDVRFS